MDVTEKKRLGAANSRERMLSNLPINVGIRIDLVDIEDSDAEERGDN